MRDFGTWPMYSAACRRDVDALLKNGGSLSAYIARKSYGVEPRKDSWSWRLEREIERRFKVKHAVAVNSGTAALHCALSGLGLAGAEVVVSPYTFSATVSAIIHSGGRPVFADIDPYTFCITKEAVSHVITKKTAAILPVDIFGRMDDRSKWKFGIPIVEDSCQAVGARIGEHYSGTQGLLGCYSFQGSKQVPAGEAGALVTNSGEVSYKARLLMNHGESFWKTSVGFNYRPNELTCCVAYHGLVELKERNNARIDLVGHLGDALWPRHMKLDRLNWPVDGSHVYYTVPFIVRGIGRTLFTARMRRMGIAVQQGYVDPLYHLPAFRKYIKKPLPVVEDVAKRLCLFNHVRPPSTKEDMEFTAHCIREALCE